MPQAPASLRKLDIQSDKWQEDYQGPNSQTQLRCRLTGAVRREAWVSLPSCQYVSLATMLASQEGQMEAG